MAKLKLTKTALRNVRRRAEVAMKDPIKFGGFSISPEAVLLLLDALEEVKKGN